MGTMIKDIPFSSVFSHYTFQGLFKSFFRFDSRNINIAYFYYTVL